MTPIMGELRKATAADIANMHAALATLGLQHQRRSLASKYELLTDATLSAALTDAYLASLHFPQAIYEALAVWEHWERSCGAWGRDM